MEIFSLVLVAGFALPTALGDVGFNDANAYLKTFPSDGLTHFRFELSEPSELPWDIDLKSQRVFAGDELRRLIYQADIDEQMKYELFDMLTQSFMAATKSRDFLKALSDILAKYPDAKQDL